METLILGLMDLGWIEEEELPRPERDGAMPYWESLSSRESEYLSFLPEDVYSAGWGDSLRREIRRELTAKLQGGEIDLVIAMGTWAGQDLATDDHSVPTLVMSTSDPNRAGYIPPWMRRNSQPGAGIRTCTGRELRRRLRDRTPGGGQEH